MKNKIITLLILTLTISMALFAVTACKQEAIYSVDFIVDGQAQTVQVVDGGKVEKPEAPNKAGYNFDGWFAGNEEWSFEEDVVTGDVDLEARFSVINYTISYELNGGTVATANPTNYTVETATITLNNPSKDYYNFLGWQVGNGAPNPTTKIEVGSIGNKSFTAIYAPIEYTITYVLNGGLAQNKATYTCEDTFTLAEPIKPGYSFTGWTYDGQTTPIKVVTVSAGTNGNLTYTANYEISNIQLSYSLFGGTVADANPTSITVETDTFTLNNPTRIGSTFVGWTWEGQNEPQLNVTIEKGSLLVAREFIANYQVEVYNITYVLNGGVVGTANPTTYTVEDEFTLNNPVKADYVFLGWTWAGQVTPVVDVTIAPNTMIDAVEFTANFEAILVVEDGVVVGVSANAVNLTSINIPNALNGEDIPIEEGSLKALTKVVSFTVEAGNTVVSVIDGNLYSADGATLIRYAAGKTATTFVVGEDVTTIVEGAFAGATSLTEVIIPDNVVSVGSNAFEGNNNVVVKVESSESSANYANDWAQGVKDVIYDYLTGDDDDNVVEF